MPIERCGGTSIAISAFRRGINLGARLTIPRSMIVHFTARQRNSLIRGEISKLIINEFYPFKSDKIKKFINITLNIKLHEKFEHINYVTMNLKFYNKLC